MRVYYEPIGNLKLVPFESEHNDKMKVLKEVIDKFNPNSVYFNDGMIVNLWAIEDYENSVWKVVRYDNEIWDTLEKANENGNSK